MRGLGRLLGKAAAGAAPVALEKWRNDVLAQRDAKLRQYQVEDRDVQIANQNQQAQLNREQDQGQFDAQMRQRATEFDASNALDERRTRVQERSGDLEGQRVGKLMEQLDVAIQSDQIALQDRQALQKLFSEFEAAETPEAQDKLLTNILARQGKERKEPYRFIEGTSVDPDTAERISTLIRVNESTGEYEFIGSGGGAPGGSGMMAPPQGAIDELLKDPSPEAIAEFNEVFGAGAAEGLLPKGNTETPAASRSRVMDTDTPRGGGILNNAAGASAPAPAAAEAMPENDTSILEGFEEVKPAGNPRGMAMANPGTNTAPPRGRLAGQMEAGKRAAQRKKNEAAEAVKKLIAEGKLPNRSNQRQMMIDAMESGLLTEEEIAILTAHLNRK
jgi:hypothetical protein